MSSVSLVMMVAVVALTATHSRVRELVIALVVVAPLLGVYGIVLLPWLASGDGD